MYYKKDIPIIAVFLILLSITVVPATAQHYYCKLGQIPLTVCDSIITIKFDPDIPQPNYSTFAATVPGLDEAYEPEREFRDFFVFHVDSGYNIESIIDNLYTIPAVQFAFPAYRDPGGEICILNDLFIIAYKSDVSQEEMDSLQDYYHVQQIDGPLEFTASRRMIVTPLSESNTLEIANRFYESGLVDYSQPAMAKPHLFRMETDDPLFQYQYYLYNHGQTGGKPGIDIAIKKAWEITTGSPNVYIALIDAGCVHFHEDLNSDNILWGLGYDFVGDSAKYPIPDPDPSPGDTSAHGVACQGIISATVNNGTGTSGIAPECSLIPLKIFDFNQWGSRDQSIPEQAISRSLLIARIRKVPMVISCSWGYEPYRYLDNIARIIDTAVAQGVPIIFSVGNYGEDYTFGHSIAFPANLETTIAVGAVRKTGEHWQYSGSGTALDVVAPSGYYYSFDAGDIYSTDQMAQLGFNPWRVTCALTSENYNCTFGGTSAAAPQAAGILALVRSRRPLIRSHLTH